MDFIFLKFTARYYPPIEILENTCCISRISANILGSIFLSTTL